MRERHLRWERSESHGGVAASRRRRFAHSCMLRVASRVLHVASHVAYVAPLPRALEYSLAAEWPAICILYTSSRSCASRAASSDTTSYEHSTAPPPPLPAAAAFRWAVRGHARALGLARQRGEPS